MQVLVHAGLEDYSNQCNLHDLELCWQYAREKPSSGTPQFQALAEILMAEENLQVPSNAKEALSLYFDLVSLIESS